MRATMYFFTFIIFLLITGVSCTKKEETPEPSIEFKVGEYKPGINFISIDTSLIVDTEFTIGILAKSNSSKNITNVKILRKLDGGTPTSVKDSTTSSQALDLYWVLKTSPAPGFYEEFIVEVSDANSMSKSISVTIYTLPADPGIIVYTDKILGSFQFDIGHFFSISNGLSYDTSDCKTEGIQELIDLAYFDNLTTGHTLMSPHVEFLRTIYPSVEFWTIQNNTMFSATEITSGAFDAIETIDDFTNAIDNAVSEFDMEFADNTEEGQVIAFVNANDIKGLLKVITIQSSANFGESTILFDIKIEKNEE